MTHNARQSNRQRGLVVNEAKCMGLFSHTRSKRRGCTLPNSTSHWSPQTHVAHKHASDTRQENAIKQAGCLAAGLRSCAVRPNEREHRLLEHTFATTLPCMRGRKNTEGISHKAHIVRHLTARSHDPDCAGEMVRQTSAYRGDGGWASSPCGASCVCDSSSKPACA